MSKLLKPLLPLFAALMLTACNAANSDPTFAVHTILHAADGSTATTLPEQYVLGRDVKQMTDPNGEVMFVKLPAIIGTDCLQSMSAEESIFGTPNLNFTITPDCAETFGGMTARRINQRMAIVVNETLISAPAIRAPLTDGAFFIEGGFESLAEAEAIARQFD